jgi:hypothetical protein
LKTLRHGKCKYIVYFHLVFEGQELNRAEIVPFVLADICF